MANHAAQADTRIIRQDKLEPNMAVCPDASG